MRFTDDELAKIASWTPIAPGFDRDDAVIKANIHPILDRLASDSRLGVATTQDGGLSNYYAFLVFDADLGRPRGGKIRTVPCIKCQLSLMAPVGVYGLSEASKGESLCSLGILEPDQVCDPASPPNSIAAAVVAAVHETSPYRLVGRDVTDQPLPAGVEIYEYCLCREPWDRAFHALFADTD